MQEAEGEGDDPGMADGETGFASPGADNFRAQKENTESDGGIERGERRAGVTESGDRESDAVGNGKGRNSFDEAPAVFDDKEQAEDKEKMVRAEQDMPNAKLHVAERTAGESGDTAERDGRRDGVKEIAFQAAIGVTESNENIGDGALEAVNHYGFSREATGTSQSAADDHGAKCQLLVIGNDEGAVFRDDGVELEFDFAAGGTFPEEGIGIRSGLVSSR